MWDFTKFNFKQMPPRQIQKIALAVLIFSEGFGSQLAFLLAHSGWDDLLSFTTLCHMQCVIDWQCYCKQQTFNKQVGLLGQCFFQFENKDVVEKNIKSKLQPMLQNCFKLFPTISKPVLSNIVQNLWDTCLFVFISAKSI